MMPTLTKPNEIRSTIRKTHSNCFYCNKPVKYAFVYGKVETCHQCYCILIDETHGA